MSIGQHVTGCFLPFSPTLFLLLFVTFSERCWWWININVLFGAGYWVSSSRHLDRLSSLSINCWPQPWKVPLTRGNLAFIVDCSTLTYFVPYTCEIMRVFFFCVWLISHKVSSVGNSGPHFRIREFSFHSKSAGDPELWNQGPLFFDLAKSGVSPEGQRHWVSQTTIFLSPACGRSSRFWTIKRYNSASSLGLIFAQSLEFASSQQDPCMDSYPSFTMDAFGNLHDAWPCRQGCRRVISVGWIFRLANTSRDLVFPVHL